MDVGPEDTFTVLDEINDLTFDDEDELDRTCEDVLDMQSESNLNGSVEVVDEEESTRIHDLCEDSENDEHTNVEVEVKIEEGQSEHQAQPKSEDESISKPESSTAEEAEADLTAKSEPEPKVHPYAYIIDTFEFLADQLQETPEPTIKTLEQKQCHVIYTRNSLKLSLAELRNVREIAVDIYHGKSDFEANLAILIISTTEKDYIIDALKLHSELVMLTEIFINPKILKIIYKGQTVVKLLQQRIDLFIVNVFDLLEARKILDPNCTPKDLALNQVLKNEFKFDRGHLRNPDFGHRPISEEIRKYCRAGTHFLIAMYHTAKNQLIARNFDEYKKFLQDCRDLTKVMVDENFVSKQFLNLEKELKARHDCEMEVFKELYEWRNEVAQERQIKCEEVLRKIDLLKLVRILPTDNAYICKLTDSAYVKNYLERVRNIIVEAKIRRKLVSNKKAKSYFYGGKLNNKKRKAVDKPPENPKKRKENEKKNKQQETNRKKRRNESQSNDSRSLDFVFVNPTNVPSSFTFQNQQRNANASSHQSNLPQISRNFRRNKNYGNNYFQKQSTFEPPVHRELNAIDQKITALERNAHHQRNFQQNRGNFSRYFEDGPSLYRKKF